MKNELIKKLDLLFKIGRLIGMINFSLTETNTFGAILPVFIYLSIFSISVLSSLKVFNNNLGSKSVELRAEISIGNTINTSYIYLRMFYYLLLRKKFKTVLLTFAKYHDENIIKPNIIPISKLKLIIMVLYLCIGLSVELYIFSVFLGIGHIDYFFLSRFGAYTAVIEQVVISEIFNVYFQYLILIEKLLQKLLITEDSDSRHLIDKCFNIKKIVDSLNISLVEMNQLFSIPTILLLIYLSYSATVTVVFCTEKIITYSFKSYLHLIEAIYQISFDAALLSFMIHRWTRIQVQVSMNIEVKNISFDVLPQYEMFWLRINLYY